MGIDAILTTWTLGLLAGLRHAIEPDHVAAMSTLVAEGHGSRKAAWLGASWGAGHTSALLSVGLALGVLRAGLPARVEQVLELAVAAMLLALGVRAIQRGVAEMRGGPDAWHAHRSHRHHHQAVGHHVHAGRWTLSPRAFLVGIVHGLAGSGALVALAMSELDTLAARMTYVVLFGLGSVVAMAALSGAAGWQLARFAARPVMHGRLQLAAGVLAFVVGCAWAYPALAAIQP